MTDNVAPKKWQESGKKNFAKTDVRYWRERIYKPVAGNGTTSDLYAVRIKYAGKRMGLSLATANAEQAAQKARAMYLDLVAGGWDALLDKYRPRPEVPSQPGLSVGQYVELVRSRNLIAPATLKGYLVRFRQIVAEIKGIKASSRRFGAKGKGHRAWTVKIDAVPLASITPDLVRAWKRRSINAAGKDVLKRKAAIISVNSTLRQAKSLFGERKILRHLPEVPNPFRGVEFEPRQDMKFYGAGLDAPTLLRAAISELTGERKEELKCFLLAIAAGLRRKEIDNLLWTSFNFAAGTVQVKPTEHYGLKTNESAAILQLDPEIMALFNGWFAQSNGAFVIESERPARSVDYFYYRCNETFESLINWLRAQGIKGDKPFHTLRKIFGSLIVEKAGIFAASAALRHTNIELTNAYYVDRTVRTTSGLGSILSGAGVTEFPAQGSMKSHRAQKKPKKSV